MKYIDEFRDPQIAHHLLAEIKAISHKPIRLMEVCGTHTMAIGRYGLRSLLPAHIQLISGPGCPVCVTSTQEIDMMIKLASQDVIVTTFGDLMRVPGSYTSLQQERAKGADVRIVYSPFDALNIASKNPTRPVVFLGVGFETTAPGIAATIAEAKRQDIKNFFVFSAHKLIPPAMEALVSSPDLKIDGFICPGHVSTIIGLEPYRKLAEVYKVPCVITGFEPVDILQGILMLVKQLKNEEPKAEIQYTRVVKPEGNPKAMELMFSVFSPCEATWRGIGAIPESGLTLKDDYAAYDARLHFDMEVGKVKDPPGCRCGDVLKGLIIPPECPLFGKVCLPTHPVGPCMVSSEGSCAAYYKYRDWEEKHG
ncbi:MAG: hydrogenase formation protein HypD [Candidatus Desulfofervidaceae bacterium]|nr:hydrogenase formation protein HypD [Candidatus Desulfofervidaceae bacterium]